jgi:transcriptional regulator with XRE-family HTH domain
MFLAIWKRARRVKRAELMEAAWPSRPNCRPTPGFIHSVHIVYYYTVLHNSKLQFCSIFRVHSSVMFSQRPSEQLKAIRTRLGITTREVAELSQRLADTEGNPEYAISNAWLTQVENSDSVPSIFKLYALSVIFRVKFNDLLMLFGVDLQKINHHQSELQLPNTHLAQIEVYDSERTVSFPIRFDRSFDIDNTNLLNRMVETWGEVPISLIQALDLRHSLYGYVGLQDFTLHPLLRPGSFVQIDQRVRKIRPARWRTEHDRPIYFVELREGYACAWCDLQDGHLLLLPHPLSPVSVRRFSYGVEAEIVGQVTAVAMRLTDDPSAATDAAAKLPKRS